MGIYIATAIALLFCLILSWLAGSLLRLQGASLWILRGSLSVLCIAGAALFLWFHRKMKREEGAPTSPAATDADLLLREADRKLRASTSAAGSLKSLPVIFLIGEGGSAKTSVMLHSGIEPELLAGRVYDGNDIASTAAVNVWFARKTVFIELGSKAANDPATWLRVLHRTRPGQMKSALGKGQVAPRAALVCFDAERFAAGSDAVVASARRLADRLKEMSASLGADFPVYVLFTRMDRVPHFAEFVGNLTQQESGEVMGATLARRTGSAGLFVEEENNRISRSFDQLVYSLSEKRLEYLPREGAPERLPSIYEFPREMRKLRTVIAQFLVELTKPTQLGANCFLRGFYFSGVRPVVVNETVAQSAPVAAAAVAASEATRMFNLSELRAASSPVQSRVMQSRRVPEWTFLPHLFHEVILRDRGALAASGQSSHVQTARRVLLGSACALLAFLFLALLVSFVNNRGLEQRALDPANNLARNVTAPTDAPSVDELKQLDSLRAALVEIEQDQKNRAPLFYRFGLFSGDRIYPDARRAYFQNFQKLLLYSAQVNMLGSLRQPPSTKTSEDFQQMYSTLKAYLITTSHHEKADWSGFQQAVLDRSPAFRNGDGAGQELIRKQVAFYAAELIASNPLAADPDANGIDHARAYLKQFNGVEPIYQAMLDDAGRGKQPVNFNHQFPGASLAVVDGYQVPAAFTKAGFAVMQTSLQSPDKFSGEEWVLGPQGSLNIPLDSLRTQLSQRYYSDYAAQWRTFLRSAHVLGYAGLKDASTKLTRLVANDSPLLELFWLAKDNTSVNNPDIQQAFDSVQTLARDSSLEKLLGSGNQAYMGALSQLQSVIAPIASAPTPDPGMIAQGMQAATQAHGAVTQISQSFRIDTQGRIDSQVKSLMEQPIAQVEASLRARQGAGAEEVCRAVNQVTSKYPFNSRATQRATLQEVQDVFRPQTGTLWTLYDAGLKSVLLRQGTQFVPSGTGVISPRFIGFMERAAQFTDTLFPNGSPTMHLAFTLRPIATKGIQSTITIDGQVVSGNAQQFVWQGSPNSTVALSATAGGVTLPSAPYQGTWAVFDFFSSADWTGSNPATLEWPLQLQFGHRAVSEESRTAVRYQLETQGAQVFRKDFLEGLRCSVR